MNNQINYVFSDDTKYDVVKLRPVNPGDTYFVKDEMTNKLIKIGEPEIKKLFSNTIKEFKKHLNEIIYANVNQNLKDLVSGIFKSEISKYFEETIQSLNLLNYKGEFEYVPNESNIGDIYKWNNRYFVFYENDKYQEILTVENALQLFYTKTEVDEKFFEIQEILARVELKSTEKIKDIEKILSNYVTLDEFSSKFNFYQTEINDLRNTYENKHINIIKNYDSELEKLTQYKNTINNKIKEIENLYSTLSNNVNNYKNILDEFELSANLFNTDLNELRLILLDLTDKTLNQEIQIKNISSNIIEIKNNIDLLLSENQSIITGNENNDNFNSK